MQIIRRLMFSSFEALCIFQFAIKLMMMITISSWPLFVVAFSRSTKPEKNDELQQIERQVEKYRDVLQTLSKKISTNTISGQDAVARDKRMKKIHEYLLGQAMDESAKELPDGLFRKILDYCGECRSPAP